MGVYEDFAEFYAQGPYTRFSANMAELIQPVLASLGASPSMVLDVACGEGTFAIEMARKGYFVTGIDRSSRMLDLAQAKAKAAGVKVNFMPRNMVHLIFDDSFDLTTCWFDSLNYIWTTVELESCFEGIFRGLHAGGWFIFDINTIYGLSVRNVQHPAHVEVDTRDAFAIHQPSYDYELNMAQTKITLFRRKGLDWDRVEELHIQHGFAWYEIRNALQKAGFRIVGNWGSLRDMSPVEKNSPRIWVAAQKPPAQTV
ncbi:MAG: class I SAM-dependent methyltransferase [Chloroflexi bacterium]|nr:class I SAM-dependent methyltransferase [Chloroflexota bacterium]